MQKEFWIYLLCFALAVLLCFGFAVNVFATNDEDWLYPENTLPTNYTENSYYNDSVEDTSAEDLDLHGSDLTSPSTVYDIPEDTLPSIPLVSQDNTQDKISQDNIQNRSLIYPAENKVVGPVTPSNSNGFKSVVLQLLGNYDPIIAEYSYTNTQGYVSYIREVQPDYVWMCSTAIFAIVLFCFFRFLGGLIKK